MKKTICLVLAILMVISMIACGNSTTVDKDEIPEGKEDGSVIDTNVDEESQPNEPNDSTDKEPDDGTDKEPDDGTDKGLSDYQDPITDLYIEVRSAEALAKMREMASCSDTKLLEEYLQASESGARTKEELEQFIKLIDTIPYVSLIEGELTWACHQIGESIDTGTPYNILSISTKAENGEWVRIEYQLDSMDTSDKIANALENMDASAVLVKPIQSKDKNVTVYTEIRKEQTAGKSIWWTVDIDGIFARIIYSTKNMDAVETESVFSNCTVTNFDTQ